MNLTFTEIVSPGRRNPRPAETPPEIMACCPGCQTVHPDGEPGQRIGCLHCHTEVNLIEVIVTCRHCGDKTPALKNKQTICPGCGQELD